MHWICRLTWIVWSFWQCYFFQSKNMVYVCAICLCHLWYQSSASNSFMSTVFWLFREVYSLELYSFLWDGEWDCFINFTFSYIIINVYTCSSFLYILYPARFLCSLMTSSSHVVASSGFSVCSIIVTVLLLLYFFFTLNSFYFFFFSDCCG